MNRTVLMLAAALAAAPLAFAHAPEGTPKPFCEDPINDWWLHDYGPASGGQFSFLFVEGNTQDCDGDTVPYDADGHYEYAAGGAWFPVWSFQGTFGVGDGSVPCLGAEGHHPPHGVFNIADVGLGSSAQYLVAADHFDATGLNPGCGDGFLDYSYPCSGPCIVSFPPGLDGSYYVIVDGTLGHVWLT